MEEQTTTKIQLMQGLAPGIENNYWMMGWLNWKLKDP